MIFWTFAGFLVVGLVPAFLRMLLAAPDSSAVFCCGPIGEMLNVRLKV